MQTTNMKMIDFGISQVVGITRRLETVVLVIVMAGVFATAVTLQMFWHFVSKYQIRPEVFFATLAAAAVLCVGIAVAFNTAICKQQQLEERIRELEDEQLRAARLETIFDVAVTVNHEINNPLTTILTGAQFLLRRLPDADETTEQYLSRIVENADRIAQVTRRLREVTEPLQKEYVAGTTMLDWGEKG